MTQLPIMRGLVFLVILFCAAVVQADDNRGRVMYIRGSVTALDESTGVPRVLRADSRVRLGEIIETGPKSVVQIVFPDRSMMHVKSETRIKVEEFNFTKGKPEDDSMVVNLLKGGMRSLTGVVGKRNPEQVKYKTPVATIGIRGTILEISQTTDGSFKTMFDYGQGYVLTEDKAKLLLGSREAGQVSADGSQLDKIPYERGEDDPALIAARLAAATASQIKGTTLDICDELTADQILLLVAMGQNVPDAGEDTLPSTITGFSSCLPVDVTATMLATTSYINPDEASDIMASAIEGGANVAIALESVLRGMAGTAPDKIQDVIRSAVEDHGLDAKGANNILDNLSSDGICR